jgi:copper chaperone CopZ
MHRLRIPAMVCSACVAPIRRALMSVDPSMRAQFMLDQRRISLETRRPLELITQALSSIGYPAHIVH